MNITFLMFAHELPPLANFEITSLSNSIKPSVAICTQCYLDTIAGLKVTGMFLTTVCFLLIVNECKSWTYNEQREDKLKLLDEESNVVQLSELHRNVTLLLGNANSGKSVFAQWITGDNLISKQSDGEFLIKHRNGSAISSHTIFPELVMDSDTNAAFYDTPTFTFNIPPSHSIEGSYFLKKVLDHVQNLKIVMVVNYSMLKQGGVDSFGSLLRNVTKFVKNIDKFMNCVGVVVTRVDEHATTDSVVEFLRNAETSMYDDALELSHILLQKNEQGQYPKLGVFRKPDKSGPLSEMAQFQLDKKCVKKMLDELEFAKKEKDDFEFFTGKFSNNENSVANEIDDRIGDDVSELVRKIGNHYENLFSRMNETKNELLENSEAKVDEDDAQNFKHEIEAGEPRISAVIQEINEVSKIKDVSRIIVDGFKTTAFKDDIEKIRVTFDYLSLFSQETATPWTYLFEPVLRNLSSKKEQFRKVALEELRKIDKNNEKLMGSIGNAVEDYYRGNISETGIEKIISELEDGSCLISKWVDETCAGDRTWYRLPEQIRNSEFAFYSWSMMSDVDTFIKNGRCFMFLRVFGGVPFDICNSSWVSPLLKTKRQLDSLHEFMVLVRDLYRTFSEYDIQSVKNFQKYNNLLDIIYRLFVEKHQNFLNNDRKISYPPANFTLDDQESNSFYRRLLDEVVDKTLGSEVSYDCSEPDTLIVRGDFVKFSDFVEAENLKKLCKFNVARLKIHALKVVFIDRDVKHHGLELSIIAPVWDVIGWREINLDGVAGPAHEHPSADGDNCWGCNGYDGLAGLPGGPGGNFLGIGLKFNNLENLTISARGGPGGPGQHGGFGSMGTDGRRAFFGVDETVLHSIMYDDYGCVRHCLFEGKSGQRGGNGGQGGVGGLGGMGGNITLLFIGGSYALQCIRKENGVVGNSGIGGAGGMGGRAGEDISVTDCREYWHGPRCNIYIHRNSDNSNKRAESGQNGVKGISLIGLQQPEGKEPPSIADTVRAYKHYLRRNLDDFFKKASLLEFTNALDNNPEINNTVDYQALLDEFLDLEKQRGNQRLIGYFKILYESLQQRTIQYAENPKGYDQSNTEALTNLTISIESKLEL